MPGDLFGELALLEEGALRTADGVAVQPIDYLTLVRSNVIAFRLHRVVSVARHATQHHQRRSHLTQAGDAFVAGTPAAPPYDT